MKFNIEQIAIAPERTNSARRLLEEMGFSNWVEDTVTAEGDIVSKNVFEEENAAHLQFSYGNGVQEFEILDYLRGNNWIEGHTPVISHIGMHCTATQLEEWRAFFEERGIGVAQEVKTTNHTNPAIRGKRFYKYVIFDTRHILGVDIKFIVRRDVE